MPPSFVHQFALPFGLPLVAGIVLIILFASAAGRLRARRPAPAGIMGKPLMTENEKAFYRALRRALPGYHVFPQVAFAAFLTHDGKLPRNARAAVRNRFSQKIADFVVCDKDSLKIAALVELDDRTHDASADRERDALTSAAGYRTIRFESTQKPNEIEISALFSRQSESAAPVRLRPATKAAR